MLSEYIRIQVIGHRLNLTGYALLMLYLIYA